jgi:hypothetical protein
MKYACNQTTARVIIPANTNSNGSKLCNLLSRMTKLFQELRFEVLEMNNQGPIVIAGDSLDQMMNQQRKKGIYPDSWIPKWSKRDRVPSVFTPELRSCYYLRFLDIAAIDGKSPHRFNIWLCQRLGSRMDLDNDRILSYGIHMRFGKEVSVVTVESFFVIGAESEEDQRKLGRHALALCIEWAIKYYYANLSTSALNPLVRLKIAIDEEDGEKYKEFLKRIGFKYVKHSYVFPFNPYSL